MGWLTDNPERAERITQLATQTTELQDQVKAIDAEIGQAGFRSLIDSILESKGVQSTKQLLEESANALPVKERQLFRGYVEKNKDDENWLRLTTALVICLGIHIGLQFVSLPISGPCGLAAIGIKAGIFVGAVAASISVEVIYNLLQRDKYIEAEIEASIARLHCKYIHLMFEAIRSLHTTMRVAHCIKNTASSLPSGEARDHLEQQLTIQYREIGEQLLQKLEAVSYVKVWEVLHDGDVKCQAYLNADLPMDDLIARTQEAVRERSVSGIQPTEGRDCFTTDTAEAMWWWLT